MLEYINISSSRSVAVTSSELSVEAFEFPDHSTDLLFPPIGQHPTQLVEDGTVTKLPSPSQFGVVQDCIRRQLKHLHAMERVYPNHPKLQLNIGLMLRIAGDTASAIGYFERLARNSNDSEHKYLLAESYAITGATDLSDAIFAELAREAHSSASLRIAEAAVSRSDWTLASEQADRILERHPGDWRAYMLKGTAALRDGEPAKAISFYRSALANKDNSPSLHLNMAVAYHLLDEPSRSLEQAFRSLSIFPQFEPALRFVADLSCHLDVSLERAGMYLERYLRADNPSTELVTRYAEIQYRLGNVQSGIDALTRIRKNAPTDPAVLNNLGVLHSKRDRKTAQSYFYEALRSTPRDSALPRASLIAARNLAASLTEDGRFSDVARDLDAILTSSLILRIAEDSDIAPLLATHVRAATEVRGPEGALSLAQQYLALDALDTSVRVDLGNIATTLHCFGIPNLERAHAIARDTLRHARSLKRSGRRLTGATNNLAYVLLEQGNRAEAMRLLSDIAHEIDRDSFVTATFGLNAFRKGDLSRAEDFYSRAMRIEQDWKKKNQLRAKRDLETIRLLLSLSRERDAHRTGRRLEKLSRKARHDWVVLGIAKQAISLLKGQSE